MSRHEHPTAERLNAFVEETLGEGERAAVDTHLSGCTECRTEVTELRSLFTELSALTAFSPAPGFADRVMADVRVRRPAFAGAGEWVERFVPATTRGWAAAVALLALPVTAATVFATWLLSQPGVTAQGLWTVASGLAVEGVSSGAQWVWARLVESSLSAWLTEEFGNSRVWLLAAGEGGRLWPEFEREGIAAIGWLTGALELLSGVGTGEIGLAAVVFATLTAGSIYVLYQNLFRPVARRTEHASYVF